MYLEQVYYGECEECGAESSNEMSLHRIMTKYGSTVLCYRHLRVLELKIRITVNETLISELENFEPSPELKAHRDAQHSR